MFLEDPAIQDVQVSSKLSLIYLHKTSLYELSYVP